MDCPLAIMKRLKKVACLFSFAFVVLICFFENDFDIKTQNHYPLIQVKIQDLEFEPSNNLKCRFSDPLKKNCINESSYLNDNVITKSLQNSCQIIQERKVNS